MTRSSRNRRLTAAAWTVLAAAAATEAALFTAAQKHEAPSWSLPVAIVAAAAAFCALMWLLPRDRRQ
jgi:ABC-type enterobactin transport system permease subunit